MTRGQDEESTQKFPTEQIYWTISKAKALGSILIKHFWKIVSLVCCIGAIITITRNRQYVMEEAASLVKGVDLMLTIAVLNAVLTISIIVLLVRRRKREPSVSDAYEGEQKDDIACPLVNGTGEGFSDSIEKYRQNVAALEAHQHQIQKLADLAIQHFQGGADFCDTIEKCRRNAAALEASQAEAERLMAWVRPLFPQSKNELPIPATLESREFREIIDNEKTAKEVLVVSDDLALDIDPKSLLHETIKERNAVWGKKWNEWHRKYIDWDEDRVLFEHQPPPKYRYIIPDDSDQKIDSYIQMYFDAYSHDPLQKASIRRALFLQIDRRLFGIFGPSPERTMHVIEKTSKEKLTNPDGSKPVADQESSEAPDLLTFLKPPPIHIIAAAERHNGRETEDASNQASKPMQVLRYHPEICRKYRDTFQDFWNFHKTPTFADGGRLPLHDVPEVLEHRAKKVWVVSPDLGVDLKVSGFNETIKQKLRAITRGSVQDYEYRYIIPDYYDPKKIEVQDAQVIPNNREIVKEYIRYYDLGNYFWVPYLFTFVPADKLATFNMYAEMTLYEVDVLSERDAKTQEQAISTRSKETLAVFLPRGKGKYEDFVYFADQDYRANFREMFVKLWNEYNQFHRFEKFKRIDRDG